MARDWRLQVAGQGLGDIQGYKKGNNDSQRLRESQNGREITCSQERQHAKVRSHNDSSSHT